MYTTELLWCAECGGPRRLDHSCVIPVIPDRTRRRTDSWIVHVKDESGKPTKERKIVQVHNEPQETVIRESVQDENGRWRIADPSVLRKYPARRQVYKDPTAPNARVFGEKNKEGFGENTAPKETAEYSDRAAPCGTLWKR